MSFPFNEPENVAVFTCSHILDDKVDICYVTHDEDDGAWQFLCGQTHTEADARIVSLKEMVDMDSSIGALAGMPLGCGAVRDNSLSPWKGFKKQE
jgi:hypothetical protein